MIYVYVHNIHTISWSISSKKLKCVINPTFWLVDFFEEILSRIILFLIFNWRLFFFIKNFLFTYILFFTVHFFTIIITIYLLLSLEVMIIRIFWNSEKFKYKIFLFRENNCCNQSMEFDFINKNIFISGWVCSTLIKSCGFSRIR